MRVASRVTEWLKAWNLKTIGNRKAISNLGGYAD